MVQMLQLFLSWLRTVVVIINYESGLHLLVRSLLVSNLLVLQSMLWDVLEIWLFGCFRILLLVSLELSEILHPPIVIILYLILNDCLLLLYHSLSILKVVRQTWIFFLIHLDHQMSGVVLLRPFLYDLLIFLRQFFHIVFDIILSSLMLDLNGFHTQMMLIVTRSLISSRVRMKVPLSIRTHLVLIFFYKLLLLLS